MQMRPEHPRNEAQRPPPLPTAVPPPPRDAATPTPPTTRPPRLARARAFLAIQRLRARDHAWRAFAWGQKHPAVIAGAFAAVLVAAGAATAAALGLLPGVP